MSPRELAVTALLVLGVAVTLFSCLGVLVMRDAYDRLHYTTPAAVVAPVAIAAAVELQERLSAAGIKAVLVALVLAPRPKERSTRIVRAVARCAQRSWTALGRVRSARKASAGKFSSGLLACRLSNLRSNSRR